MSNAKRRYRRRRRASRAFTVRDVLQAVALLEGQNAAPRQDGCYERVVLTRGRVWEAYRGQGITSAELQRHRDSGLIEIPELDLSFFQDPIVTSPGDNIIEVVRRERLKRDPGV